MRKMATGIKYIRVCGESGSPALELFNMVSQPCFTDSIVLSRMLSRLPEWQPSLAHDPPVTQNLHSLQTDPAWEKIPLKLVDVMPCSLGGTYFQDILQDDPARSPRNILFFDGELPYGKLMPSDEYADFSEQCLGCGLRHICGTTAACYGSLCHSNGRWSYREE